MRVKALNIIAFTLVCISFVLLALVCVAPYAYAESSSSSSSSASEGNVDYSVVLGQINAKLDELPSKSELQEVNSKLAAAVTKEDIADLSSAIEAIAPVDNSQRIDAMNEFFAALMTLNVYQWVTLLLLVGVLLVLVWLVSYRSHT